MAYFRKNAIDQAEAEVAGLQKQRERLVAKEMEQQSALAAAVAARKKSLRDDEVIDNKAVAAALAANTALAAIRDALADVDVDLATAEAKVVQARDNERRQAEAAAREADLAAAQDAFAELLASTEAVVETFSKLAGPFCEALNVAAFTKNAAAELALAAPTVFSDVKSYIAGVTDGRIQIYGYAAPPPASPRPPPIPTTKIYTLENLKWVENGATKTLARHMLAAIPAALADKAIAAGVADYQDTVRARQLLTSFGSSWAPAEPDNCFDLDSGVAAVKPVGRDRPYMGPANVTHDLGLPAFISKPPAVTGTIAARRFDAGEENDL